MAWVFILNIRFSIIDWYNYYFKNIDKTFFKKKMISAADDEDDDDEEEGDEEEKKNELWFDIKINLKFYKKNFF